MNIFTNDDYRRIQAWLKANAIKDSDFAISENTVPDEDILVITQNMSTVPTNYKIKIKNLLNSSLGKVVIDKITANIIKINNSLTVDASKVILNNEKGTTLQDVLNYFEENKLNRHTDDTFDGNLTVKKNITIEGNIKSHDDTITVEADLEATGEITDGQGNMLSDVNDASKGWKIEYQDPQQDEPTVRAKYVLKDYRGVPKGNVIKIYKDSAITNVYLGTIEDTCNPDTGEVTKHPIHDNNEALSIVYRLDTGKYSLVNVPIKMFATEAEFDKYRGLGVTENGQVFIKLASDVESSNYLHFNELGEITADGIETRILRDLGNIITSVAGDDTMWGVYKEHEGTQETSTPNDGSRWGEFKKQEAIREEVSNSAHQVFADNWDAQDDDPTQWEDPIATESNIAYNWKTTDTPASDGKTEGNLKDLYEKTLSQEKKIIELVNGKRIEPTNIEENKLVYVNGGGGEERILVGFKLYRFVAPENGKYNIKTFINSVTGVAIGENPNYIVIGKGSSNEFAEFETSINLSAKEKIVVSVYGDYIPKLILQSINLEATDTSTIKASYIVYGKYIQNGEYKLNSACRIFYYDVVAGNNYFVEADCFGIANIDENDAITKFEPLSPGILTKTRFISQTNKIAISTNIKELPIITSISDSNVGYFVDGVNEAPKDRNLYGRKNGEWEKIESTTKVFEHGLLEDSGIINGIVYFLDGGSFTSMELSRYNGYHVRVKGNTKYIIYSCSFNIVQKLEDGTYLSTHISNIDNEKIRYEFTTNANAVELYWSSLSTINDIARAEDELCIKGQGEESVCVEKSNSQTPQLYINNIVVSGNKKIVEKGVLLDLYKYPLLPCWGHEYLSCYYNKLINGDDIRITFDGDSITAQGYRRDVVKSIFEVANYSGNVTLNNLGYGSRSCQEWAGTGQYYNPGTKAEDLVNLPNGIIDKSMATNPDLLICGMGVNDAVVGYDGVSSAGEKTTIEQRLQLFENAYREVLERVRGTEPVNDRPAYGKDAEHLGIILCTPTHSCGVPEKVTICRDDDNWHIYVRQIIQRLCREYKCAFCDFSLTTYDLAFSPNNVWGDSLGLHPTKAFTYAYAQYLQQLILPLPFWKNNKLS